MSKTMSYRISQETLARVRKVKGFREYQDCIERSHNSIINEIFAEEEERIKQKIKEF